MNRYLVLSFRFLSPWFHGRGDEGAPEWPPSPLRAFQAVVAAAARAGTLEETRATLRWLEKRAAPLIVAPEADESDVGYRLSVPHNAMDIVGRQWTRGVEGNPAEHRAMKNVRPHQLPQDAVVHYAWQLDGGDPPERALVAAARGVVALGWGVDLVVGDGTIIDGARFAELSATMKVWEPRSDGGQTLRTPKAETLRDLERRHAAFLSRTTLSTPLLNPPAALSVFDTTRYARTDQPRTVDIAGFTLMRAGSDRLRAFDTARSGKVVAGMLRHAVRTAAERAGWEPPRVHGVVLGHGDTGERLLLVPIPSVEPRGHGAETAGPIRRVMVFSTDVRSGNTEWAARALGGMDLIDERTGDVQAVIAKAPRNDRVLKRYTSEARCWATVTPVVLPGHDDPGGIRERLRKAPPGEEQRALLDRLARRRDALVRKALRQAGIGDDLILAAEIEMRDVGFIAGVEKASRYLVPSHLVNAPRLHVKLRWPVKVAGPLCIGRGRFSGMGLFATLSE